MKKKMGDKIITINEKSCYKKEKKLSNRNALSQNQKGKETNGKTEI
jgi:hypothetical protein